VAAAATTMSRWALAAMAVAVMLACCAPCPAAAEWKFCAPEGGHCHCFGEMRFGHPGEPEHVADDGAWFKAHPEVTLNPKPRALHPKP